MKAFFSFAVCGFLLLMGTHATAQTQKQPDWRQLHYLSAEEMSQPVTNNVNFTETDPPEGGGRMVAEFEPMQAVLIRYPLGIPYSVIAEMAADLPVITIVSSNTQATQVLNLYTQNGINTDNCSFLIAQSDSYWTRDYGPWYVFDGNKQPGIVDFPYDRPRPNDNLIPVKVAEHLGINLYGMNLVHTGGNMMVDGRGMAASTDLVYEENTNYTTQQIQDKVEAYLGVTRYDVTIDPLDDYIKHIDCWGKYLAPDKILIGQVPASDYRYDDYEAVANYFETTPSAYGYPYKVYRTYSPGTSPGTPYTNSLILNNKVLVPLTGSQWDDEAIAVYEEAMPGYEIIGVPWTSWYNTDALHCRTKGVADLGMLFIDHRPVYGTIEWQDSVAVTSKIIPYSGEALVADSVLVFYSINGGSYQTSQLTADGNDMYTGYIKGFGGSDTIDYFVFAKDESGRRLSQPYMGALDPHEFILEANAPSLLTISPDTLVFDWEFEHTFSITNETGADVTLQSIENITPDFQYAIIGNEDLPAMPFVLRDGETLPVLVYLLIPVEGMNPIYYYDETIRVSSSAGEQDLPVKINMDLVSGNQELSRLSKLQVYPNPFTGSLTIEFTLEQAVSAQIELIDLTGRSIALMVDETLPAGKQTFQWDGQLEKGIYFCRIQAGNQTLIQKIIRQ